MDPSKKKEFENPSRFGKMRVNFGPNAGPKEKNTCSEFCKNSPGRQKTLGALCHFYDQLFELYLTFFIIFYSKTLSFSAILIFHFQFSSWSYNFFHLITYLENVKKVTRFLVSGL